MYSYHARTARPAMRRGAARYATVSTNAYSPDAYRAKQYPGTGWAGANGGHSADAVRARDLTHNHAFPRAFPGGTL